MTNKNNCSQPITKAMYIAGLKELFKDYKLKQIENVLTDAEFKKELEQLGDKR